MQYLYFNNSLFIEYGFGVVFLNIIIYLMLVVYLFCLLFLLRAQSFVTLNELRLISINKFFLFNAVIVILSMAGMPPMFGFAGKLLLFLSICNFNNFLILFLFVFINVFLIYFYIQNIRFLVNSELSSNIIINNFYGYLNFRLVFFIICLFIINFLGFYWLEELLLFINL